MIPESLILYALRKQIEWQITDVNTGLGRRCHPIWLQYWSYFLYSHRYTHLIPVLGIVREPGVWRFITSPPSLKDQPGRAGGGERRANPVLPVDAHPRRRHSADRRARHVQHLPNKIGKVRWPKHARALFRSLWLFTQYIDQLLQSSFGRRMDVRARGTAGRLLNPGSRSEPSKH